MVVIANLLDSMCSCLSDQACGGGGGIPGYAAAAPARPPSSSASEDVLMTDAAAAFSVPTTDGRQSNNGSPTGSSVRSSSPRSSPAPSPSHFLKFRGGSGTEWKSLVRRTSCGAASAASASASAGSGSNSADRRPSSPPTIHDADNVMRCLDMDNAQMALAHARQQVGARAHHHHHAHNNSHNGHHNKRKASADIFRSRRSSPESESSPSDDHLPGQPSDMDRPTDHGSRVGSPVPLGGLCAPTLRGVLDESSSSAVGGVRSLLRFPGLCFANPIRGSSSDHDEEPPAQQQQDDEDEDERPASPAYLLERELAERHQQRRQPLPMPMPLYRSQQVVHAASSSSVADDHSMDSPLCLTDIIRQQQQGGGSKKMRLAPPSSAPASSANKPSFAFSSSSETEDDDYEENEDVEEENEEASVESTPATLLTGDAAGHEQEAPITPTALDAYAAIAATTPPGGAAAADSAATTTASAMTTTATATATHQITPHFTPSASRPHKQPRMKSPFLFSGGGLQALGSGPSVPELLFASTAGGGVPQQQQQQQQAPRTPAQQTGGPDDYDADVRGAPVTPEKPYLDV